MPRLRSLVRVLVVAAGIAAVAWSAWSIARPVREDGASLTILSPAEARQREILLDSLGRPGDTDLMRRYAALNERHFAGHLPEIPVNWEPRLAEVGALAGRSFTLEGMFGHIGKESAILLHPNLAGNDEALDRALSHEMVHAYLHQRGSPSTSHGPQFQAELQRLAEEGAFVGISADPATRAALRAWLDGEAARLDADSQDMQREGEELDRERAAIEQATLALNTQQDGPPTREQVEALNARRDAYNRRAEAANSRAERGRAALAEFNRQVERYNLMLAYPDGVDEGDLMKPR